ncbi:MAG TPA: phage terminase large subunit family protein [Bacteroidia bacterium]|nr:phage terminase large subunit family protein [Bacteroidia bacterium]
MDFGETELGSPERRFLAELVDSCFQPTPSEPAWKWASTHVWLSEKESATPMFYDPELTPWAKEWHQIPLQHDVREVNIMKSSRSGASEAFFNVARWMPDHWPGNVLVAINSRDKAKEVSKKRIIPHLERTAGAQLTSNPDDVSTLQISLKNMDIIVSGSGSAGPFMEAWYRLIILDELENHQQDQETTTYDRAKSRQATVPDGKLVGLSKPELAGGIIDLNYIRGTQEKWMVPCHRCGQRIELMTSFLRFDHCKDLLTWDLARVLTETWYQCNLCGGRIEEKEKRAMVAEGLWIPTPAAQRRRPPSGLPVAAEPGNRSFHISDLYSPFAAVSWGFLAKEYLSAYVIEPNEARKKYFRTNHEGWPWEPQEHSIDEDAVLALRGGIVEEKEDGRREVIGTEFELCYVDNELRASMPFRPKLLTITADRQQDCIKFLVFAWLGDGQAFLIDVGRVRDREEFLQLRLRPYYVLGFEDPVFIFSGLIDCGYQTMDVYRLCLEAQDLGWEIHPSRGSGWHSNFHNKTISFRTDYCDQRPIIVRDFFDHRVKFDFYLGKIGRRSDPRLWLPKNVPASLLAEWRAERLQTVTVNGRPKQQWVHDAAKHGPNDYGDCGKQQYIINQEIHADLATMPSLPEIEEKKSESEPAD